MANDDDEGRRWLADAWTLAESQGVVEPSIAALSDRLCALDALIRTAPPKIRNSYVRIEESGLCEAAETRLAALEQGRGGWSPVFHADEVKLLHPAAIEVRATDLLLRRVRPREVPMDADTDWRAPSHDRLVVPCRERRGGAQGRRAQPYERRGILHHRILPRRIGRYTVELIVSDATPAHAPTSAQAFRGGAAMFKGLELSVSHPEIGTFLVERCRASDLEGQLEHALASAHLEGCTALVWPELTIDPDSRELISAWLQSRLMSDFAHAPEIPMVVAGSWHEVGPDGAVVNRSVVYDGLGAELLSFEKAVAYHNDVWGTEGIRESRALKVLLLEDTLVAFGICRDFADTGPDNPLFALDVDLVLVPSMGNRRTVEGHLSVARIMADRFATRAFVVQQADAGSDDQLGYVVPPRVSLSGLSASDAIQKISFDAYEAIDPA